MKTNSKIIYSPFLLLLMVFILLGGILLFVINKGDIVLFCNENQTQFFNLFFKISTKIIEEKIMFFVLAILVLIRYGTAFLTALTWGVSGLIAQSLKRILSFPRPALYFQDTEILNFIVAPTYHFSFPSGHTTAAFAVFSMIAFCSRNKWIKILCFFIALIVGFSRIYLLQHFFIDVYTGAILGTSISFGLYIAMEKYAIFGYHKWKEKGLKKSFRF